MSLSVLRIDSHMLYIASYVYLYIVLLIFVSYYYLISPTVEFYIILWCIYVSGNWKTFFLFFCLRFGCFYIANIYCTPLNCIAIIFANIDQFVIVCRHICLLVDWNRWIQVLWCIGDVILYILNIMSEIWHFQKRFWM